MRSPLAALVVTFVFSLLSACGNPRAGEKCTEAGFLCESASSALECKVGVWTALPCRGPDGCARTGDTVSCDMRGNVENDLCASSAEGKGLCTADNQGTLECRQGVLLKTNTCRTCTVANGLVTCTPP